MSALLELRAVRKCYGQGADAVCVLDGIDLDIEAGGITVVVGSSGSGKSTLLNLMGGLDRPTTGCVRLDGQDLAAMSEGDRTVLRRRRLGFVFQFFNLLPGMSMWQNVAMPLLLDGVPAAQARAAARELAQQLGLGHLLDRDAASLSGGEAQRAAVARALIHDPVLVLADEPTGNLDSASGRTVVQLLSEGVRRRSRTLVIVTHDAAIMRCADRIVRIADGRLVDV